MSDMSLMDNLNDLKNLLSNIDSDIRISGYPLRYEGNSIEGFLNFIMGKKVYLNRIDATEKDSCQYENKPIDVLKGIDKEMFVSIQAGDIAVNLKNKALEKNNTKNAYAW